MDVGSIRRCVAGMVLALAAVGLGLAPVDAAGNYGKALAPRVTAIDFNACVPYQVRAQIMDRDPENGTIVVAEREIRMLDVVGGAEPIKTEYLTLDGKPESPSAFTAGQYVWVKGVLHPDGYVGAFFVQRINKPQDEKFIYKPVAESKAKTRRAGRQPAAAGSN
jgi:hypothetical protein